MFIFIVVSKMNTETVWAATRHYYTLVEITIEFMEAQGSPESRHRFVNEGFMLPEHTRPPTRYLSQHGRQASLWLQCHVWPIKIRFISSSGWQTTVKRILLLLCIVKLMVYIIHGMDLKTICHICMHVYKISSGFSNISRNYLSNETYALVISCHHDQIWHNRSTCFAQSSRTMTMGHVLPLYDGFKSCLADFFLKVCFLSSLLSIIRGNQFLSRFSRVYVYR